MEERTVNGMPIREVWEKLQAEFPSDAVKKHPSTGMAYIPVEKIEERLNNVVGLGNWDFELIALSRCAVSELMALKAVLQAENSVSMTMSVYLLCAVPAGRQMSSILKNQHVRHLLQIRLILLCRMFLNDVQKGSGLA